MHNIAMRPNDNNHKFSGDWAECWEDFNDKYDQGSEDYGLSDNQSLRFLHNLVCKDVHRFYLDMVDPVAQLYKEDVLLFENEYNSIVRQTPVKTFLNDRVLEMFPTGIKNTAAALAHVYKQRLSMSREVLESYGSDARKLNFYVSYW